uniref:Hydrolase_4 domain-containing protein n=1 Tax=Onchocerca volvulus TaxID=6282 RepID=A0A2K6VMV0_ONCVO
MLLLKYTGILCYVFCCPPIPEMITRKLAFHPPIKGRTYVVWGMNVHGNLVQTNNAKKASKFISLKFEAQHLTEASPIPMEGIEIVVLFSQPNSSDLGCYFQPHGINFRNISDLLQIVLYAYDYSGYGISTDSPSEKNIYADVEAAYKHIFESQGPHVRIALLGYSIGTAPTIYMASKHPPNLCGIVLIAPFTSGLRLCGKAERTWCIDRFLNYDRAPEVNVPVLICHGCMDNVVPKSHSEILVDQFPRAVTPFFVEHANHLTIFSEHFPSVFIRIRHFLFHETDSLQHALV